MKPLGSFILAAGRSPLSFEGDVLIHAVRFKPDDDFEGTLAIHVGGRPALVHPIGDLHMTKMLKHSIFVGVTDLADVETPVAGVLHVIGSMKPEVA